MHLKEYDSKKKKNWLSNVSNSKKKNLSYQIIFSIFI